MIMNQVRIYFEMKASDFKNEWIKLSAEDKIQLIHGVTSGSLTY